MRGVREPLRNQVTDIEHEVHITKQLDLIQKRIKNFSNL